MRTLFQKLSQSRAPAMRASLLLCRDDVLRRECMFEAAPQVWADGLPRRHHSILADAELPGLKPASGRKMWRLRSQAITTSVSPFASVHGSYWP